MNAGAKSLQPGAFESEALQQELMKRQSPDGGWGFQGRTSWTEPTALALLALQGTANRETCDRAALWLKHSQRGDGGWSAQSGVNISTWLTSLVTLSLLRQNWRAEDQQRAFSWLRNQIRPAQSPIVRFVAGMRGQTINPVNRFGTSWYPGTAAWLYPTAFTVLAFFQAEKVTDDSSFAELAQKGQEYILSRRCQDGGWNHGGTPYGNEQPVSYPEMTGIALLALHGVSQKELLRSLQRAQNFLSEPASGEGLCWLELGLAAHGIKVQPASRTFAYRNPREIALRLLALSANEGRNLLIEMHSS